MSDCVIFKNKDLLPQEWRGLERGPVWCFNPSLLPADGGWWLAYRLVGDDQKRRIGVCRLDERMQLMPDSTRPLSDLLHVPAKADYPEQARCWFADPRFLTLGNQVFLYWNSGWHEPRNHQFLLEMDPKIMTPVGPSRELVLKGERRPIEKNWMLFGGPDTGGVYAVYSASPQRILKADMSGDGDILLEDAFSTEWNTGYTAAEHGELRGGAAPVLVDDSYFSFCHSVGNSPAGYRYVPSVYRFDAKPPFKPLSRPLHPLGLGNPFGAQNILPRLNPPVGEVVYPCGAVFRNQMPDAKSLKPQNGRNGPAWFISYGINDERCAVAVLPHAEVLGAMETL